MPLWELVFFLAKPRNTGRENVFTIRYKLLDLTQVQALEVDAKWPLLGFGIRLNLGLSVNRLIWGVCSVNNRLISVNLLSSRFAKLLRFIAFLLRNIFSLDQNFTEKISGTVFKIIFQ